jgi:hypothetical protein
VQDIKLLEKLGGSSDKLKAKFEAKKPDAKIKRLTELHANRLRNAIETNISEAPIWGAIDRALEAAQNSLPYIQARELAQSGKTHEEIMGIFQRFKLDRMLEPVLDPVTGDAVANPKAKNEPLLTFNKPLFDTVFVPLVSAYADMRAGKLFNDRNAYPRYKYSPARLTANDMIVSDIVTSRIQRMTQDMGYAADDKQSFKQMAYYGTCFNFVRESYHRQQYDTTEGEKVVTKTLREGVRFVIPHPRRQFCDRSFPTYTLNSDTGVNYCGYWDIIRYGDVRDNTAYWNRDKVTVGGYDLFRGDSWSVYQQFYPCTVTLPKAFSSVTPTAPDRIESQQDLLKDELDASVNIAVLFDKLIPKDWGLFDYDKPVWMRFVYVNLDTVIHAEILPYTPGYVYLDRYDANKAVNSSLALQIVPFQQMLGNFLTQHFMSVKQNLTRIAFVNTDIVPKSQIEFLRRMKDSLYSKLNLLMFSKAHNSISDQDQREAIIPAPNAQVDVSQAASNIQLTLMALERMLGFSAQEVGAAASHEQSATEVSVTNANTSVNLEFMGSGIDEAYAAKKRLLYTAFYTYGDDEVFATVSDLTPERRKAIEKLGFQIDESSNDGDVKFGVKGTKANLTLDSFVAEREGVNRLNDSKLGIAMMQNLSVVAGNPALFQAVGPEQILQLFTYVWKMVGLPEDFKLHPQKVPGADPQQQQEQMMQILQQAKEAIVKNAVEIVGQQIQQQVVAPLTQELAKLNQGLQQLAQSDAGQNEAIQQITVVVSQMRQTLEQLAVAEAQRQQQAQMEAQLQAQLEQAAIQSNAGFPHGNPSPQVI